jgi:signal transduction histidine kinase
MSFARIPRTLRTASFGLGVLYAALYAASTIILGGIVYWTVETSLDRQITANIDAETDLLEREFKSEGFEELVEQVQARGTSIPSLDYLLLDKNGNRVAGELPRMPTVPGWTEMIVPKSGAPSSKFRVRSVTLDDGIKLAVGDDLGVIIQIRHAFLSALAWALLAFLALSLFGGILLSRAFMRRVDAITRTAEAIIDGELTSRVPVRDTDDTFDRLSITLNRMLDRIQTLMESLGQVSNDIAHALRTPLGHLRHKLEDVNGRTPDDQAIVSAAISDTDTILETFSALLRISQIEAGVRQSGFREVDLTELFGRVTEAFSDLAEDQGKTLVAEIEPSLSTWGDRELLAELIANLLDNALRHTPTGARIDVRLGTEDSQVVARVGDNGPGIPDEERDRIFDRFYRLKKSINTPGSGLGLSLVAAVAELHEMKITVGTNSPGLQMIMTFPPGQ